MCSSSHDSRPITSTMVQLVRIYDPLIGAMARRTGVRHESRPGEDWLRTWRIRNSHGPHTGGDGNIVPKLVCLRPHSSRWTGEYVSLPSIRLEYLQSLHLPWVCVATTDGLGIMQSWPWRQHLDAQNKSRPLRWMLHAHGSEANVSIRLWSKSKAGGRVVARSRL